MENNVIQLMPISKELANPKVELILMARKMETIQMDSSFSVLMEQLAPIVSDSLLCVCWLMRTDISENAPEEGCKRQVVMIFSK